jgi:hypothetical protein
MAESIRKALKLTKLVSALEKAAGNVDSVVKKITGKDATAVLKELAKKILRSEDPKRAVEFFRAMVLIRPLHTAAKIPFISDELLTTIEDLPHLLLKAGKAAFKKKDYDLAEQALVPLAEVRTNSVMIHDDCVYEARKLLCEVYARHRGLQYALTYCRERQESARMKKNGKRVGQYKELYRNLEREAKKKKSSERTPKDPPSEGLDECPMNTLVVLYCEKDYWLVFNGKWKPLTEPTVRDFALTAVRERHANQPTLSRTMLTDTQAFQYAGESPGTFRKWTKKVSRAFNKFNALLKILNVPTLMRLDSSPHRVDDWNPTNDLAGYPFPKDFPPALEIDEMAD